MFDLNYNFSQILSHENSLQTLHKTLNTLVDLLLMFDHTIIDQFNHVRKTWIDLRLILIKDDPLEFDLFHYSLGQVGEASSMLPLIVCRGGSTK